jgi:Zn finger protein HypA/HybF involved in hydrogenase expression
MWVVKCRGDTHYVDHVDVSPGIGFSTKETPDNPHTFLKIKLFIIKYNIMNSKMNFLEKAKSVHGNKYDYSLVEYKTNATKVKIICEKHGVFEQRPNDHISKKCGCPKCGGKNKSFLVDILPKFVKVHGEKYDYSKSQYKSDGKNIIIICPIHGEFEQKVNIHLLGSGCPKCGNIKKSEKNRKSHNKFIIDAQNVHGDKFDYSEVRYLNGRTKIKIKCKSHGIFEQIPQSHLIGRGCPVCNESKGELKIREYLEKNNIEYVHQKRFKDCKDKRPLPFDFYLPKHKCCIEFDGKQHKSDKHGWFGNSNPHQCHQQLLKHDMIKTKYCNDNNLKLIRIEHKDTIEKKINKELSIGEENNKTTAKIY